MQIIPLAIVSQKRMKHIISWIRDHGSYEALSLSLEDILSRLSFGVKADSFEGAFDELGKALGFSTERPDKEWKEGPDNLWGVKDNKYLLVECKSEVELNRAEINKNETGQMNNACAWFANIYKGLSAVKVMIIPPNKIGRGAGFIEEVRIMREHELKKLKASIRQFFEEFKGKDFDDLMEDEVQNFIDFHRLSADDLLNHYSKIPRI